MSGKIVKEEKKKRSLLDFVMPVIAHWASLDDPSITKLLKEPENKQALTSEENEEDLTIDDDESPLNLADLESLSRRSIGHHEARLLSNSSS